YHPPPLFPTRRSSDLHAAPDESMRENRVDPGIAGVEHMLDIDRRLRRLQPQRMVRLVPHQPVAHPRVARGSRLREGPKVARYSRSEEHTSELQSRGHL